jgi:hypothetical protein
MKFTVIMEVDFSTRHSSVSCYNMPENKRLRGMMRRCLTEKGQSEHSETGMLRNGERNKDGSKRYYAHRKYCLHGLTINEVKHLTSYWSMYPLSVETGGTLSDKGWLPAVAMACEDVYQCNGLHLKSIFVSPEMEKQNGNPYTGISEASERRLLCCIRRELE